MFRLRPIPRVRSLSHVGALSALLLVLLLHGCPEVFPTSTRGGRIVVHQVTAVEQRRSPTGAQALVGDWVIESPYLRVVVGGLRREPEKRGAILEARSKAAPDDESIVLLAPTIHHGRRRLPVPVSSIRPIVRDGRAALRLAGDLELPDGTRLRYTRELTLATEHAAIGLWSMVVPSSGAVDVRFGERIGWGGAEPWVPGLGRLRDEAWHDASFVGVDGEHSGTVFAIGDASVRVAGDFEAHGAHRFLSDTEAMGPVQRASRRVPATERSFLVVSPRGIAEAVRRVGWLRGHRFPEAYAFLPYVPEGTRILVQTLDGTPVLEAAPDANRRAVLPLPPLVDRPNTVYRAVATANGHAPSDGVGFRARQSFTLEIPRGGRVRISARDATTGRTILARVRFVPLARGEKLALGPDWSANGAGDAVLVRSDSVVVPLPAGAYRVIVSHGPEWTLHTEEVRVTETFRPDVKAELVHVVEPGPWVPSELHVHAAPSPDSQVSLEDRVASLVAEGIEFAVPTDHNHVTDYAPSAHLLGVDAEGFLTVPGVEATTWDPHFGHFNAYPVPADPNLPDDGAPAFRGLDPRSLFEGMRALGPDVVVQVNHPRLEGEVGYFDRVGYDPVTGRSTGPYSSDYDLLEVWNGFDMARAHATTQVFRDWLAMVARGRRVTAVGNSDSHQIRYQWAGYPRTYVRAPERTPSAIVAALRAGHAFVTSGPFLEATVGEAGPGDLATCVEGVARVHVRVRVPAWMGVDRLEIHMQGQKVRDEPIALAVLRNGRRVRGAAPKGAMLSYEGTFDVEVDEDTAIVVLVRGSRTLDEFFGRASIPPLAFTNPIWIDFDGDGQGPPDPGDAEPSPGTWEAVRAPALDAGVVEDAGVGEDAGVVVQRRGRARARE